MSENDSNVSQNISGKGHQIAGRDVINNGDFFNLDPENPILKKCYCEKLISRGADECPECGHNHLADRIAEQGRIKQRQQHSLQKLYVIVLLVLIVALQISTHLSIDLLNSIGLSVIMAGILWLGYICLRVYLPPFLKSILR